jgi:site-specific recombinase XerD
MQQKDSLRLRNIHFPLIKKKVISSFYMLRHSTTSIYLKLGVHPKIVSELLGYATLQITLNTYSHVALGLAQASTKSFDEALTSSKEYNTVASGGENE